MGKIEFPSYFFDRLVVLFYSTLTVGVNSSVFTISHRPGLYLAHRYKRILGKFDCATAST